MGDRIRIRRIRGNAASRQADQFLLLRLFGAWKITLVVDESHRIKRFRGGVWAPALMELARYARVRQLL